jgi:hypothetical protein
VSPAKNAADIADEKRQQVKWPRIDFFGDGFATVRIGLENAGYPDDKRMAWRLGDMKQHYNPPLEFNPVPPELVTRRQHKTQAEQELGA